jgi:hypothetical protein
LPRQLCKRRKLHREFPFFFSYTVAAILSLVRIAFFYWSPKAYFYGLWVSQAILITLGFLVIYEVLVIRIFRHYKRIRWLRYTLIALAICAVIAGVGQALYWQMAGPMLAEMGLRLLQVLFFGFLLFFVVFLGHPVQRYEFGIALGYGVYATVMLFWTALRINFGQHFIKLEIFPALAYDVSALIWFLCFAPVQREQQVGLQPPAGRKELEEANRWKRALRDFIRR